MNTAKRSAASRKAWRTRKRMQAARSSREAAAVAYREYMAERAAERKAARSRDQLKPVDCMTIDPGGPYETTVLIVADSGSSAWPEYKRRALPLPDFGKVQ